MKKFTDVVDFVGGKPVLFEGTKPYVSTGALKNTTISREDIELVEFINRPSRADLEVKKGDILFAKMAFTDKRILIDNDTSNYIYSTGFFAVRAKPNIITTECLYYLLNSKTFKDQKDANSTGATQKAITNSGLKKIYLRIPNYNNQKEIAEILSNIEKIISFKERQLKEYDQLIKSRFVEMFGDPIKNDKRWKTDKLNTVCPVNKYKGQVESNEGKVWLLNLDMIESNTGKIIKYVFENESDIANSTIKFNDNCVLYSKLRPYLNKVVVPLKSGYATSEIISMQTEKISKYFLFNLLRMKSFVDFANGTAYGAKMPRASVDRIKNFDLILPPIDLQNKFEKFVLHVDKLKFEVQKSLDESQTLFDSLMQEYFG